MQLGVHQTTDSRLEYNQRKEYDDASQGVEEKSDDGEIVRECDEQLDYFQQVRHPRQDQYRHDNQETRKFLKFACLIN